MNPNNQNRKPMDIHSPEFRYHINAELGRLEAEIEKMEKNLSILMDNRRRMEQALKLLRMGGKNVNF